MVFDGIRWYFMVFWYSIVFITIQWNSMVLQDITQYLMIFNCIRWYCIILHGIRWYCMAFNCIDGCYSMEFDGIAGYYIIFNGI